MRLLKCEAKVFLNSAFVLLICSLGHTIASISANIVDLLNSLRSLRILTFYIITPCVYSVFTFI